MKSSQFNRRAHLLNSCGFNSKHQLPSRCRWLLALVVVAPWLAVESASAVGFALTVNASSGTRDVPGKTDYQYLSRAVAITLKAESTAHETGKSAGNASWVSDAASVANGTVGPGSMSLFAQASGTTGTFNAANNASGGASAVGSINDDFVILAPGCTNCPPGRLGKMTFAVSFLGKLGGGGSAQGDLAGFPGGLGGGVINGSWNTSLSLQAGYLPDATIPSSVDLVASGSHIARTADGSDKRSTSGLGLGVHLATVAFEFGKPINIQWQAGVFANAEMGSTGAERSFVGYMTDEADFSTSFAWGGILSVVDETGASVTGFTALNGSGVSYLESFAAPVLDVALHTGDRTMTLSWASGTPSAFRLESTLSLTNPDWQPVVGSVVESITLKSVSLPISDVPSEKFFRLHRSP